MGERRGTRIRGLIGVLTAGLIATACAAGKGTPTRVSAGVPVAERCGALVEDLSYARKSVAGPVAVAAVLTPLGLGIGLAGTAVGMPQGLVLPFMAIDGAVRAVQESRREIDGIRAACLAAEGPEHIVVARSIGFLATRRHNQGSSKEAVRLYRDALALLERARDEDVEGALRFRLDAASVMAADPSSRDEAAVIYAATTTALESRLGPEHADLVDALEQYARLLRTLGRGEEAERLEARAVAIRTAMTAVSQTAAAPETLCDDSAAEPCTK